MISLPLVSTNVIALTATNTIGDNDTVELGSFTIEVCNLGAVALELEECG
jgi:hypothetical protein